MIAAECRQSPGRAPDTVLPATESAANVRCLVCGILQPYTFQHEILTETATKVLSSQNFPGRRAGATPPRLHGLHLAWSPETVFKLRVHSPPTDTSYFSCIFRFLRSAAPLRSCQPVQSESVTLVVLVYLLVYLQACDLVRRHVKVIHLSFIARRSNI